MSTPRAAYTWDDSQPKVTVTAVTEQAVRTAHNVTGQTRSEQPVFKMSRAQFRRFQMAFAKVCKHPAARLYAWVVDDVLYSGCSDCGTLFPAKRLPRRKEPQ